MSQFRAFAIIFAVVLVLITAVLGVYVYMTGGLPGLPAKDMPGTITTFEVIRPDFVVKGERLTKVEVWAVPTGTGISEESYSLIGTMRLMSDVEGAQEWRLTIPSQPILATEIFVQGYDLSDVKTNKRSLVILGATELYNLLWGEQPLGTFKVGDVTTFGGITLEIIRVTNDSRCPSNVQCIQAGEATVAVKLSGGEADAETQLSSTGRIYPYGGYSIKITDVTPKPIAGQTIGQSDYRITISAIADFKG